MKEERFNDLRREFSYCMASPTKELYDDPWWRISTFIEEFNEKRFKHVAASRWKILDELMCAYVPRSDTGGLPNLTFIIRKPEPLGTEMKCVACPKTGIMLGLEIQRGKNEMKKLELHKKLGATSSCVARLAGLTSGSGQPHEDANHFEVFAGDSWFSSVRTAEYMSTRGYHFIGQVKNAHKRFPKDWLNKAMDEMAAGTWLVLRATTAKGVNLIAMGYKYCKTKVLHFIMTEGCGSTDPGQPYIAKFRNRDGKLVKKHIARPKVLVEFFGVANIIDVHNHIRQGTLRLEKRWRTEDCWFRLFTSMVGIILTDCWLGYKFAIKMAEKRSRRRHRHHDITLQEFTDWMANAMINNPYTKNTEPEFVDLAVLQDVDSVQATSTTTSSITTGEQTTTTAESTTAGSMTAGSTTQQSVSSITYESRGGKIHSVCKFIQKHWKETRQRCRWCTYTKPAECNIRAWHYCKECAAAFCYPGPRNKRNCFMEHVQKHDQWLRWEHSRRLHRQRNTEAKKQLRKRHR